MQRIDDTTAVTILVTGATGRVGAETARLLAVGRSPVRAFVRSAERAEPLRSVGVDIAVGDFDDAPSVRSVLEGVGTLVLVSPGNPRQEHQMIDAAAASGVGHVIYVSSKASLDAPIERRRWHAQVEVHLAESGLPHTVLRPNAYMQNVLGLAPVIAATGGFASSAGDGRMGMVDTRDVAAVSAVVAANPAPHAGKTYLLTGPEAVGYAEVARTLAELLGSPVVYRVVTEAEDRAAMIERGVPEAVAAMNAQAFHLNATGDADWISPDVVELTGEHPRSFHRFAVDHLAAFRP